ncbi:hypothetical protein FNF28_04429 [Cafeteria roenbergensis]|uniref:Uncharacterized protein n=1 Tax=Cafeteria roenbergensis TaxID=33653 RepID=A0A5A8DDI0_CAFRO|nr:hypothetical protein FNF28_04429 [Cafeteria roenbergensis]
MGDSSQGSLITSSPTHRVASPTAGSGAGSAGSESPRPRACGAPSATELTALRWQVRDLRAQVEALQDELIVERGKVSTMAEERVMERANAETLLSTAWPAVRAAFEHGVDVPPDWADVLLEEGAVKGRLRDAAPAPAASPGMELVLERAERARDAAVGARHVAEARLRDAQEEVARLRSELEAAEAGSSAILAGAGATSEAEASAIHRRAHSLSAVESEKMHLAYNGIIADLERQLDEGQEALAKARSAASQAGRERDSARRQRDAAIDGRIAAESLARSYAERLMVLSTGRPRLRGVVAAAQTVESVARAPASSSSSAGGSADGYEAPNAASFESRGEVCFSSPQGSAGGARAVARSRSGSPDRGPASDAALEPVSGDLEILAATRAAMSVTAHAAAGARVGGSAHAPGQRGGARRASGKGSGLATWFRRLSPGQADW